MAKFLYLGYYNDIDAVMMNNETADKIVSNMANNIGHFYNCEESCFSETDDYLCANHFAKRTTDGNYIVVFDVADRFNHIPLDLVVNNANDEYIDIWKKID